MAGCTSAAPTPKLTPVGEIVGSWILEVESPGPYWLGTEWFRGQGVEAELSPDQVRLRMGGREIPFLLLEGPDGPGIFFFATHTPSRYASWSAYRLDIGQGAGQVMATAAPPTSTGSKTQDTAWTGLWREQDLQYRPQITAPVSWFWQPVYSGESVTYTLALTEAVAGPITLTARIRSRADRSDPGPPLRIWWDGEQAGSWAWDGPDEQSWPAELTGLEQKEEHILALDLPEQPTGSVNRIWLDGWGVTFRKPLILATPDTIWTAEADEALVTGASGGRFLDVTDPTTPLDLGVADSERLLTQPGHHYWVGFPQTAPSPVRTRSLTTAQGADLDKVEYLIVAPEPFWAELEPLVEHRESQGLTVHRLTPTQVYDTYGDGRPDPAAIRSLVQELHGQGQLRYLLLVGDASTRPDGYAGEEGTRLVVTELTPTAHLHETPSDMTMITNSEGWPLIAVGRFPAETAEQVKTMVDKTLQWEEKGLGAALVLSDDQADFGRFAEGIEPWLPDGSQQFNAAQEDTRARLLEQLDQQGTWLNYVGHGSLTLWGDEKILQREDEWAEPAAVTVWACLSGYFVHPQEASLAEVWLRSPGGGAAVFVGPTGETYLHQQQPLAEVFYKEIQAGEPVGDALLAAWQSADDSVQDAARSYLLLGDPALRLDSP